MKVNHVNLPVVNPYKANEVNMQKSTQNMAAQTDKLEISSKALELSETSSYTAERNEHIQKIKAQVDAGTYQIDSQAIAKKLIAYYK